MENFHCLRTHIAAYKCTDCIVSLRQSGCIRAKLRLQYTRKVKGRLDNFFFRLSMKICRLYIYPVKYDLLCRFILREETVSLFIKSPLSISANCFKKTVTVRQSMWYTCNGSEPASKALPGSEQQGNPFVSWGQIFFTPTSIYVM